MVSADTKTTILDAAEELFAEHGFAATSLRQLTARAGVNLAAVNYHFGSKEQLAQAVLARRIEPIQAERQRRLDALERPATLEHVLRAFVEPAMRGPEPGAHATGERPASGFCRLFGRLSVEQPPFLRDFIARQFRSMADRFLAMLAEAAPGADPATLWWRMHFVVGAMAHTLQNAHVLGSVSRGRCDPDDHDGIVEQLIAFAVGGLQSPAPQEVPR